MKYKTIDRFPLAEIQADQVRGIDRLAALSIYLLKNKMIDRREIGRVMNEEIRQEDRELFRSRLNHYLEAWKK